jgi:DNA polymerase-3 subunit beta
LLIPPRALEILSHILADLPPSENVGIQFSANGVIFTTTIGSVWSRLVEGRFPPWRDVIPKKTTMAVPIDAASFLSAIKRAKVMTDTESIRVKFEFQSGKVVLNANAQLGASEVVHSLDWTGEESIEISFDPKYLLSFLSLADAPLELKLVDGQKSGVFSYDNGDSIYLVVPLV